MWVSPLRVIPVVVSPVGISPMFVCPGRTVTSSPVLRLSAQGDCQTVLRSSVLPGSVLKGQSCGDQTSGGHSCEGRGSALWSSGLGVLSSGPKDAPGQRFGEPGGQISEFPSRDNTSQLIGAFSAFDPPPPGEIK